MFVRCFANTRRYLSAGSEYPQWTELYALDYEPVVGMSLVYQHNASTLPGNGTDLRTLSMDVSMLDFQSVLPTNLEAFGISVAIVEPALETQFMLVSSGDIPPYRFDANGTAAPWKAKLSSNAEIKASAELLEHFSVEDSPEGCAHPSSEFCIKSFPVLLDDFSGTAEQVVSVYRIVDEFGLDVLAVVTLVRATFVNTLFSWHALSFAFVLGAINTVAVVVVWLGGAIVKILTQAESEAKSVVKEWKHQSDHASPPLTLAHRHDEEKGGSHSLPISSPSGTGASTSARANLIRSATSVDTRHATHNSSLGNGPYVLQHHDPVTRAASSIAGPSPSTPHGRPGAKPSQPVCGMPARMLEWHAC